jgi:RNA polymerase sigma-70 factor, ECF subfamily
MVVISGVDFEEIYRRHAPAVYRRAHQLLGVEDDAHETVQEVFLALYQKPEQFSGRSSLSSFLYGVVTHHCLNKIRNHNNRQRLLKETQDTIEEDRALNPEQRSLLHKLLRTMPEELAQVVIYYYVDDLSQQEIARVLNCSRRHVGHLLERARGWADSQETCSHA